MIVEVKSLRRDIIRRKIRTHLDHLERLPLKHPILNQLSSVKRVFLDDESDLIDFVCEFDDEELRSLVSNAWRDSMLERMNSVGTPSCLC